MWKRAYLNCSDGVTEIIEKNIYIKLSFGYITTLQK